MEVQHKQGGEPREKFQIIFQHAKYAELRLDDDGNSILIGLYDENLKFIQ